MLVCFLVVAGIVWSQSDFDLGFRVVWRRFVGV